MIIELFQKKGANIMKHFNKIMIFFLFILASFGRDISAYRYTITNLTGTDVKIQLFPFQKEFKLIHAYDTKVFSPKGIETIACLTKIMVSPFNEELNRWLGETKADIKAINEEQFNKTKSAIKEFTSSIKTMGEAATIKGPKGVAVKKIIDGLADMAVGATALYGVSLCRNRDFLLVLDQIFLADGRAATIKKVIGGELVEIPLIIPYLLGSP